MFTENKDELEKFELHLAAYNGDLDWVKDCLNRGFEVNLKDQAGYTPLHWNAFKSMVAGERLEVTETLIKAGADVNSKNKYDDSVLVTACQAGNSEVVKLLLENNARVNENPNYTTALINAVRAGSFESVKLLIEYGENINTKLKNGVTALNTAIGYEWNEIADYLKEKGAIE